MTNMLDVIGIGFGPANIALAIALEELESPLTIKFFEKNKTATWQNEMLLDNSDIQNHPLRDLVTPRNPRSRYSFTNFLFENNRLFEHLNLGLLFPLRVEYQQYVTWVASFFEKLVNYDTAIVNIEAIIEKNQLKGYQVTDSNGQQWQAKSIVMAPGRTPNIPKEFQQINDPRIIHFTKYLTVIADLIKRNKSPKVAVIGGSQTAVELLLDLASKYTDINITGISRNFGFRQKDTSPFSDEVYFPSFVDLFFNADQAKKQKLRTELQTTNYSSTDIDVLEQLYVKIYQDKILNRKTIDLKFNTNIKEITPKQKSISLTLANNITEQVEQHDFDLVILATGFLDLGHGAKCELYPPLCKSFVEQLEIENQVLTIDYDYRVNLPKHFMNNHPIYLNGLCESSHGMGDAGSFSLLALRSSAIVDSLEKSLTMDKTVDHHETTT